MFRDFTYVDDIVDGVVNILNKIPKKITNIIIKTNNL